MNTFTKALIAATAALSFIPVARARVVERIVAVVGDDIVLESEVNERAAPFMQELAGVTDQAQRKQRAEALRREVLDRVIDEKLLLAQAAELKVNVSHEEIDRAIEMTKRTNGFNDAQLVSALQQSGQTMASYRQNIRNEIMKMRVVNIAVGSKIQISDNDVQSYYERNMKSGANVQVHVRHIFVKIPENGDAAKVLEREQYTKKLLARAKAPGADFGALAKEVSEDAATRAEGGDLGMVSKGLGLPKAVEEVVFNMKTPGEIAGPVRANQGFHIFYLVERKAEAAKPLDEVKDDLRGQLREKELERQAKNYLNDLRKRTLVEVRL